MKCMMEKNNKIFEVKDIKENILELHFFKVCQIILKKIILRKMNVRMLSRLRLRSSST